MIRHIERDPDEDEFGECHDSFEDRPIVCCNFLPVGSIRIHRRKVQPPCHGTSRHCRNHHRRFPRQTSRPCPVRTLKCRTQAKASRRCSTKNSGWQGKSPRACSRATGCRTTNPAKKRPAWCWCTAAAEPRLTSGCASGIGEATRLSQWNSPARRPAANPGNAHGTSTAAQKLRRPKRRRLARRGPMSNTMNVDYTKTRTK